MDPISSGTNPHMDEHDHKYDEVRTESEPQHVTDSAGPHHFHENTMSPHSETTKRMLREHGATPSTVIKCDKR